jgi:hypothetical protein
MKTAVCFLSLLLAALLQPAAAENLSTPEDVRQYIANHRSDVALVSYSVTPDGRIDASDPVIQLNPDQPMPLASTIKIIVLAAYAREVEAGRLDPSARIKIGQWESAYIPLTDGGAHPEALQELGIPFDEFGFAKNPGRTVTLDQIVRAMIRFSDNAATDLLIGKLGPGKLRAILTAAGLTGQEIPLPVSGLFLSWENHVDGPLTPGRLQALTQLRPEAYAARVRRIARLFQEPAWKMDEFEWLLQAPATPRQLEAGAANLYPKGTARDYARIMARVATGTFLSPAVSATMRRHLGWPMEFPSVDQLFTAVGSKGGSLEGVLTGAWYLIPKAGDFTGKIRVSALFFRHLPLWAYDRLQETGAQQLFELSLGLDRGLVEAVGHDTEDDTEE